MGCGAIRFGMVQEGLGFILLKTVATRTKAKAYLPGSAKGEPEVEDALYDVRVGISIPIHLQVL